MNPNASVPPSVSLQTTKKDLTGAAKKKKSNDEKKPSHAVKILAPKTDDPAHQEKIGARALETGITRREEGSAERPETTGGIEGRGTMLSRDLNGVGERREVIGGGMNRGVEIEVETEAGTGEETIGMTAGGTTEAGIGEETIETTGDPVTTAKTAVAESLGTTGMLVTPAM